MPITITDLPLSEIDRLKPLWTVLHTHHAEIGEGAGIGLSRTPDESWPREREKYARLPAEDVVLVVAADGPELVGYAFVYLRPALAIWRTTERVAELETLVVHPDRRGAGIGTSMLDAVQARLRDLGDPEIWASILAPNKGAARFYERLGFGQFSIEYRREPGKGGPG
jgi:ribosomal protein S18 acetylase RimI-like enzyme